MYGTGSEPMEMSIFWWKITFSKFKQKWWSIIMIIIIMIIIIIMTITVIIIIVIIIIIIMIIISLRLVNTGSMSSWGWSYLMGRGMLFSLGWQSS